MSPVEPLKPLNPATAAVINDLQAYYLRYVSFPDPGAYSFVLALWSIATHMWPSFDAFPYVMITSETKRSGKTRTSELMSFVAANAHNVSGVTPATIFRMIRDDSPTIIIDEAETLSSESADMMRSIVNVGYRRGQTIPRMSKTGVEHWPAYCPKVFVLIGETFDTLRDRCIIMRMQRAKAPQRFLYDLVKGDGELLRDRAADLIAELKNVVIDAYASHAGLDYLQDRDAELWMPLFAVCSVFCSERLTELTRVAVDMSMEKTAPAKHHRTLEGDGDAEEQAFLGEYGERLVRDVAMIMHDSKAVRVMSTGKLLAALHELPTGPWRKFRGELLSAIDLSNLLSGFGCKPKNIRDGSGRKSPVVKGYSRADIEAALKRNAHPAAADD